MSPHFQKKHIAIHETLGEYFRNVRLGKNWTLEVAADKTKIAEHYLMALEKSRYEEIPGEVYLTNFIRVYSKHLGLNPLKTLEQYTLEKHVIASHRHPRFLKEIGNFKLLDTLFRPRAVRLALICLVVVTMLSYLAWNVYQTIAPPDLTIFYPKQDLIITHPQLTISGSAEKEARVTINDQEILLQPNGYFEKEIPLRSGLNLLIIAAQKKHGLANKIKRNVLVDTSQSLVQNFD